MFSTNFYAKMHRADEAASPVRDTFPCDRDNMTDFVSSKVRKNKQQIRLTFFKTVS